MKYHPRAGVYNSFSIDFINNLHSSQGPGGVMGGGEYLSGVFLV